MKSSKNIIIALMWNPGNTGHMSYESYAQDFPFSICLD